MCGANDPTRPFRWDSGQGVTQLQVQPQSNRNAGIAQVVSRDGMVAGGWLQQSTSIVEPPQEAQVPCVWLGASITVLPTTGFNVSGFQVRVIALSGDGRVIGGVAAPSYPIGLPSIMPVTQNVPVLWIGNTHSRLDTYLTSRGVDLQGVIPRWISGISDTGSSITGWGTHRPAGATQDEYVAFVATIMPPVYCDSIDFNNDTSVFDPQDIEAFLSVYSEGPCVPVSAVCGDIDFNNDTSLFDPCDISSFLLMYSEGPCTLCGV